ncbi:hypothetical protein DFH11DRAFT_88737 [Phellopilus nigrolimitatus]|nr:hypothetical protein DFH11DRAFT_88737 [Phellopilus nigrolimitatus]
MNALRLLKRRAFVRRDLYSTFCRTYAKSSHGLSSNNDNLLHGSRRAGSCLHTPSLSSTRRHKSGLTTLVKKDVEGKKNEVREVSVLGDEPPLYDGKPEWWRRWMFALLALDMLFTGASIDMVMRYWTEVIEKPLPSDSSSNDQRPEYEYVLRPLWQRLGLASFELLVGTGVGALILASRDRTVWRLIIKRVPLASLPPARSGMQLPPRLSKGAKSQTINILTLETASGRAKRFLMRDCDLVPARDLSEVYLRINGVRGYFWLGLNRAKVLGLTPSDVNASNVLKGLVDEKTENSLDWINDTPGGMDPENRQIAELRKMMGRAWIAADGTVSIPNPKPISQGWTSGPVVGL